LQKDELERALPVLKKAYLSYDEVAGKTVQYMFYDLFNNYRELKAETLASACFINDGKGSFYKKQIYLSMHSLHRHLLLLNLQMLIKNFISRAVTFMV